MLTGESKRVADRAKRLYDEKYRQLLEESHMGAFVCIEPESGDYFLGRTLDDAVNQAIDAQGYRNDPESRKLCQPIGQVKSGELPEGGVKGTAG
mgnify:CR=1 FL=1